MSETITSSPPQRSSSSFNANFIPVVRKKRKNRKLSTRIDISASIQHLRDQLGQDDWFDRCQQLIIDSFQHPTAAFKAPPQEVLCLGLGSPSSSLNPRVQLAFLLSLCDRLNIGFTQDHKNVFMYDPVFTAEDIKLFAELQIQLLTENKASGAAYAIDRPTLCFMPHCDMELYENLLKANWSKTGLTNLLLVANRLTDYIDSKPAYELQIRAPSILGLAGVWQCHNLPTSPEWPTAFNNTAVQFTTDSHISSLELLEQMIHA